MVARNPARTLNDQGSGRNAGKQSRRTGKRPPTTRNSDALASGTRISQNRRAQGGEVSPGLDVRRHRMPGITGGAVCSSCIIRTEVRFNNPSADATERSFSEVVIVEIPIHFPTIVGDVKVDRIGVIVVVDPCGRIIVIDVERDVRLRDAKGGEFAIHRRF